MDLTVLQRDGGFSPRNPLARTRFPGGAGGATEVGGLFEVRIAEGRGAGRLRGAVVAYPNALTDTDVLWSPVPGGAALTTVVRSEAAPERVALDVGVPDGMSLRLAADGSGAAELMDAGGKVVGLIKPPAAWDADGTGVRVAYEIVDGDLVVVTSHRREQHAYPIVVDPEFVTESFNGYDGLSDSLGWYAGTSPVGAAFTFVRPWPEDGNYCLRHNGAWSWYATGLCILSQRPRDYGPGGQFGQWAFSAPNANSYVHRFDLTASWLAGQPAPGANAFTVINQGIVGPSGWASGWGTSAGGSRSHAGPYSSGVSAGSTFISHCSNMSCSTDPLQNPGGTSAVFNMQSYGVWYSTTPIATINAHNITVMRQAGFDGGFEVRDPSRAGRSLLVYAPSEEVPQGAA